MISDKAIVDKNSKLDSSVEVGPFSIIGKEVKIGKNVKILSHVNITGDTSISDECEIYSFASIGSAPQDLKFKGEKTKLIIGKKNKIREYVTINPGTEHGGAARCGHAHRSLCRTRCRCARPQTFSGRDDLACHRQSAAGCVAQIGGLDARGWHHPRQPGALCRSGGQRLWPGLGPVPPR